MENVKYIEPSIIASKDVACYIDEAEAFGVPQSVMADIPDGISHAIQELFEIPHIRMFSHVQKPKNCHPKNLFLAYVFCDEKIKKVIDKLDGFMDDEKEKEEESQHQDENNNHEETLQEALFLLKSFNEMHREIRSRMCSIARG